MSRVFASALRASMRRQAVKVPDLKRATGLSHNILYGYTGGRYLPTLANANRLADALLDDNLVRIVKNARQAKCQLASCGRTYYRDRGPQKFCSMECTTLAAKGLTRYAPHAALDAIDEMCRTCEPQGVCRNDECPLRYFSPLPFEAAVNVPYVGDKEKAKRRATWRERWRERQGRAA